MQHRTPRRSPRWFGRWLRAVADPLTDDGDRGVGEGGFAEGHASSDRSGAAQLLNDVTVRRIARLHAHERRHFRARHSHEQGVAMALVELQAFGRAGSGMAHAADRRGHVLLYRCEVCAERGARRRHSMRARDRSHRDLRHFRSRQSNP